MKIIYVSQSHTCTSTRKWKAILLLEVMATNLRVRKINRTYNSSNDIPSLVHRYDKLSLWNGGYRKEFQNSSNPYNPIKLQSLGLLGYSQARRNNRIQDKKWREILKTSATYSLSSSEVPSSNCLTTFDALFCIIQIPLWPRASPK